MVDGKAMGKYAHIICGDEKALRVIHAGHREKEEGMCRCKREILMFAHFLGGFKCLPNQKL